MNKNFSDNGADQEAEMETRLWEYMDGFSEETSLIEKLIAENAAWKAKYAELLEVQQLIQATDMEEPSLRFTKNVMEEIARLQIAPAAKKYINTNVIWGIAAFFISVIGGFLLYGLSQIDWSASGTTKTTTGIDFGSVDYSRMFNNTFVNIFMMANLLLGLMLLDRFLSMRKKKYMNS